MAAVVGGRSGDGECEGTLRSSGQQKRRAKVVEKRPYSGRQAGCPDSVGPERLGRCVSPCVLSPGKSLHSFESSSEDERVRRRACICRWSLVFV